MSYKIPRLASFRIISKAVASIFTLLCSLWLLPNALCFEGVDIFSGVLESPVFKGKEPMTRLSIASEKLKENKFSRTDTSYLLLDWVDEYLREPSDPLERLKRWSEFSSNDKFSNLKVPRDFLNRVLLAEYLAKQAGFTAGTPLKKLEFLRKLHKKNLVEWSVALSYENLVAGSIVNGSKVTDNPTPLESLSVLKKLSEDHLIGNHYRVMAEGLLAVEVLARNLDYEKMTPIELLSKLRDLERKGLITSQTKRELEKLPAWRLLINDPAFLKLEASQKKARLAKLKSDGLLTSSTASDFSAIFKVASFSTSKEPKPAPIPQSGMKER